MFAKVVLLAVGAQAVLQSSLLEQSASAAQLQMQAENLQAMWLDYKSSEQELMSEHEGFASSLLELGNRMSTEAQQELAAKRNSAKVLQAMVASLEATSKNDQSIAVDARGQAKSMESEALSVAETMAEERLIASSRRTALTAEQTSASWMEAFVNSEDAELRTAVAQAEDAFRHLTGQRHTMDVADKVQQLWRANGVNPASLLSTNVPPLTRDNVDESIQQMDGDQDGKITWQEAYMAYTAKLQEEHRGKVEVLAEEALADKPSQEDKDQVFLQTFTGGLAQEVAALDTAVENALAAKPKEEVKAAALIEEKAEALAQQAEKLEAEQQKVASWSKEHTEKAKREQRWEKILERQQSALLQQEQSIKRQEKELADLEREEAWQQSLVVKQEQNVEESACAGVKTTMRAFITASQDQAHASCLKNQIGSCISTDVTEAITMRCDEPSAGWQKKCMAEKAQMMADCAPKGVDWNAMRRGETGNAADNAALERLSEWCTMHRALGKIEQSKAKAPFSLILSKKAALSKDATSKLADFGANFKGQNWDLLQVDPIGNPAPLHSVVVKSESAGKIQKAMSLMMAVPLDQVPKALNADPKYATKAIAWNAGVSGMLETGNADCSLQSPVLLQKDSLSNKLVAALR